MVLCVKAAITCSVPHSHCGCPGAGWEKNVNSGGLKEGHTARNGIAQERNIINNLHTETTMERLVLKVVSSCVCVLCLGSTGNTPSQVSTWPFSIGYQSECVMAGAVNHSLCKTTHTPKTPSYLGAIWFIMWKICNTFPVKGSVHQLLTH